MTLQILAILPGKDDKKNDYLAGFISISKSIHILENTENLCTNYFYTSNYDCAVL